MRGYMEMYGAYIMRKVAFCLIILILFVFAGCQPMPYDELGDASNSLPFDRETYEISASDDGEYIEVKFEVIPKAKSYGYGATSKNVIRFSETNLTFSEGYYVAKIDKNDPVFSLEDTPATASRAAAGNLSVIIFASSNSTPSNDWVMVKSVDVELSLTTAPDFTTSNRKEDSVILKANSESITGGMEYKVDYGTGKSVTFSSSELPYTLKGIGTDALTLTVSHRYAGTSEYSAQTQTLTVSEYDPRQGAIITDINEVDGSIKASNLEAGHNFVGIFSVGADGKLASTPIYKQTYSGDSVTFDKTVVFGEGFYAGKIRVVLYNNSSTDEDAVLGEEKEYKSPIEKVEEKIGKQSYSVIIPISDKISVTEPKLSAGTDSNIKTELTSDGNVRIWADAGTLISRTKYSVGLTINTSAGNFPADFEFTTGSFAGNYLWETSVSKSGNYAKQFAVIVEETPVGSAMNYYVYTSPDDVYFTNPDGDYTIKAYEKLRISPLFDENVSQGMPYSSAPRPYIWNNEKWNSSDIVPDSFDSYSGKIETKDYTTSVVRSTATFIISTWVDTSTSIKFVETNDGCYLVFYNKITEGKMSIGVSEGNKALLKNPGPYDDLNSDEYHYALKLQ